jgi:uncharacterized protein (TIGR02453 family)
MSDGEFRGFRPAAMTFLRSLKRNNTRDWFQAHRDDYEREIRAPLVALVEEMDVRLAELAPEIVGDPKRSLFRIHRDVRFSSDKSPYKTNAACWFYHGAAGRGVGSTTPHGGAGFYFHMEPGDSMIGGGIWMPPCPTLTRIREHLDEEHASLRRILRDAPFKKRFGTLDESAMLTRMPRGFAEDHPAADLLRHQSFTVGRSLTDAELFSPKLAHVLARDYARLVPLVRWFNAALGLRMLARR